MFLYARVSIVFIEIYIGETIMKKLLSIAMLSLALTACGNTVSKNVHKVVTLDNKVLTVNCYNFSYIDEEYGYMPYTVNSKVSKAIKEYCLSRGK